MRGFLRLIARLLCGVVLLRAQNVTRTHPSHWELVGPGGGGALFQPTISPVDAKTVAVVCDMTGSYLTQDGGASWRTFNLRGEVRFFAFDTRDRNTLYAKSNALWRTRDAGKSWDLAYPPRAYVRAINATGDHAAERLLTGSRGSGQVSALAVDPRRSSILYASFQDEAGSSLRMSKDYGQTWKRVVVLPGPAQYIFVRSRDDQDIYLASENYVARWNGRTLRVQPMPEADAPIRSFTGGFREKDGEAVFYTAANGSVFVRNTVEFWTKSAIPVRGATVRVIAASRNHPEVAYASFTNQTRGAAVNPKPSFGVARTRDAGKTWEIVWDEAQRTLENTADDWIGQTFGAAYAGNPVGLAVDANNPDIVYATDLGRVLHSTDGGQTWRAVYARTNGNGVSGIGMEATTSYGVHFDPFNPQRVFVSYTDIGLMRSEDGGKSWQSSLQGVPKSWSNTTYWLVFDPVVRGRVWAVMSKTHDLPRPKMWKNRSSENYDGGVVLSEDGGRNWKVSNQGMAATAPTHILLETASHPEARVLYVTAMGRGVYKSVDGGRNWMLKNSGIAETQPLAWRLVRDSAGILYVIIVRRSDDGSIGNSGDGDLYRSGDGAEHWTKVHLPAGVNGPNGLAIDPQNPKRIYVAAWGRNTPKKAQGGGIFLSSDGGTSWTPVLVYDQHIYDVTVDPRDPRIIYAAGFESSAWRSEDRGATWKKIRGFDFKWGHRVIPDPSDPSLIYVTTFGGGVWHGPAAGDPSAPRLPLPE